MSDEHIIKDIDESTFSVGEDTQVERWDFDARRKELTRTITTTTEFKDGDDKLGVMTTRTTQTYNEQGIKDIMRRLRMASDDHAKRFASINSTLEATKHIADDPELDKFIQLNQKAQDYLKRKQAVEQRDYLLKDSETTRKQLKMLVSKVGEHVKVD